MENCLTLILTANHEKTVDSYREILRKPKFDDIKKKKRKGEENAGPCVPDALAGFQVTFQVCLPFQLEC